MADNPNIGSKRAIEISKKMTDGHKFNIFVLPYYNATYAELYCVLRQRAME